MQYRNQGVAVNEFVGSHTNLARMFSSSLQKSAMFSFRGQRRYPRPTELRFQPSTFTYSWYQNFRRFTSDSNMVLWSLIGANGAVFLLWRARPEFAARHTVVSLDALRHGRYWTLITSGFSQADIMHLGSNMISLYFFGKDIGRLFGGKKLLGLYLSGAIAGSMAHVLWTWHRERQLYGSHRIRWGFGPGSSGALGASAAVNAIVLMDVLLFPTRTILLYGKAFSAKYHQFLAPQVEHQYQPWILLFSFNQF